MKIIFIYFSVDCWIRDPNGTGGKIWTPCISPRIEYLHIKNGEIKMCEDLLKEEYEFLEELYSLANELEKEVEELESLSGEL